MKKLLGKITTEEQIIMSMIAVGGMIITLIGTAIYLIFWYADSIVFKILTGLNTLFGLIFLTALLAGTYQQYKIHQATKGLGESINALSDIFGDVQEMKGGKKDG